MLNTRLSLRSIQLETDKKELLSEVYTVFRDIFKSSTECINTVESDTMITITIIDNDKIFNTKIVLEGKVLIISHIELPNTSVFSKLLKGLENTCIKFGVRGIEFELLEDEYFKSHLDNNGYRVFYSRLTNTAELCSKFKSVGMSNDIDNLEASDSFIDCIKECYIEPTSCLNTDI